MKSKHSTLYTIVRSYVVVLLLPMLFGILLHSIALQMIRTEGDKAQMQVLSHVEGQVNFTLENMNSIIDTFLVSGKVENLSRRTDFGREEYQTMNEIQRELILTRLSNDYIDDLILYFHNSDTVLSSQYELKK